MTAGKFTEMRKTTTAAETAIGAAETLQAREAEIALVSAKLRRVERRDWWLWWATVVVMLLLTLAVVSFTFPNLFNAADSFFSFNLTQSVRGLVGLVLLFNIYTIFQQIQIKRLRRQLAAQLELAAHLELEARELQKLAIQDSLTGLYNRRFAEPQLETEIARAVRSGKPLSILMLDLDNFKRINDRYGHLAGDRVLVEFSERLRRAIRHSDLPARLGGDEFLVLLPECDLDQVRYVLDRMPPFEMEFHGESILVNASSGWATYESGEEAEDFLGRADDSLYASKRTGRSYAPAFAAAV